jgi:hypothetical protein
MQVPLKKNAAQKAAGKTAAASELDKQALEIGVAGEDQGLPSGGSAYVEPHSFGGASLVKDAREAALKVRSLLG